MLPRSSKKISIQAVVDLNTLPLKTWRIQLKIYNCDFLIHGDIQWYLIHESAIIAAAHNRKFKPRWLNQTSLLFCHLEGGSLSQIGSFTTSWDLRSFLTFCSALLCVVQFSSSCLLPHDDSVAAGPPQSSEEQRRWKAKSTKHKPVKYPLEKLGAPNGAFCLYLLGQS